MNQCEDREDGVLPSKTTQDGGHDSQTKAQRMQQQRPDSLGPGPGPSCVSIKSDHSMYHPISFEAEQAADGSLTATMYKPKAKHCCSVIGCTGPHMSPHRLPNKEDLKAKWLNFVYQGNVPASLSKNVLVCANHFTSDCFSNHGQYTAGLATRLLLKDGSIPTVRADATDVATTSTTVQQPVVHHVACQTDQPVTCNVGTQLSMRTLQPHFRSTGTQKSVSCADVGVGTSTIAFSTRQPFLTSTPIKRPSKRARLELEEEEEENPLEGSSSMEIPDPKDSTYDPEDSVTVMSESADVTLEPSCPVHKTPTYIVYEKCLMELFEVCPVCQRVSDVQTRRVGTFISVEQTCPH